MLSYLHIQLMELIFLLESMMHCLWYKLLVTEVVDYPHCCHRKDKVGHADNH